MQFLQVLEAAFIAETIAWLSPKIMTLRLANKCA